MGDKIPDRRTFLKAIATGSSVGFAGVSFAKEQNTPEIAEDNREKLFDKYSRMEKEELKQLYQTHAGELLQSLSQPVQKHDTLVEQLSNVTVQNNVALLNEPSIDQFESAFDKGGPDIRFNVVDKEMTSNLLIKKETTDYKLLLAVEPEAGRSYAIVKPTGTRASTEESVVIDTSEGATTTSSCMVGTGCQEDYYYPCGDPDGCPKEHFITAYDIHCCPDTNSCYWGEGTTGNCNELGCPNCEYWCGFWNCCHYDC